MTAAWYFRLLACPDCLTDLSGAGVACAACGYRPPSHRDLRASTYAQRAPLEVATTVPERAADVLARIDTSRPQPLETAAVPGRDSRELLALIARRYPHGGCVLDLGCGPREQSSPLQALGFDYVGVDYDSPAADLLADAHALPFRDRGFDVVFSFAVLEHLHTPQRALAEVARVLRPDGLFIGTVSQGEPFHASYFHFTPWGLVAALSGGSGLELVALWASEDTLRSLATMSRYPRAIKLLLGGIERLHRAAPWLALRRMRLAEKEREIDALYRAGSLSFACVRRA